MIKRNDVNVPLDNRSTSQTLESSIKRSEWQKFTSRLVHTHDVRALELQVKNGQGYLLTAGVDIALVCTPTERFRVSPILRLPIHPTDRSVHIVAPQRFLTTQHRSEVLVWQLSEPMCYASMHSDALADLASELKRSTTPLATIKLKVGAMHLLQG